MTITETNFLFSFFIGYVSHLIADGIIHPYVRDMVGDYNEHKEEHRVLEMKLDVLYFEYITKHTGKPLNLNYTDLHDELANFENKTYPQTDLVLKTFSNLIKDVYNYDCSVNELFDWVKAIF